MPKDPTNDEVLAFAAGELSAGRIEAVAAWVESNPQARQLLSDFQRVAALAASDDSIAPPRAVTRRAVAIPRIQDRVAAVAALVERFKAVVAHLTFDSRLQPLAIRSDPSTRHLTFESDVMSADLSVTHHVGETADGIALSGQIDVSSDAAVVSHVSLCDPDTGNEIKSVPVSETGYFSATLPEGPMEVLVNVGGEWIHLPDVSF